MKLLRTFSSYSRVERLGAMSLALLLLIMIIVRTAMHSWIHPRGIDPSENSRMYLAYREWQSKEAQNSLSQNIADVPVATVGTLFAFDPNTLDSAGFVRLGFPQRALKGLLNWRRKGKHFYKPEDLKPLYNLPESEYARLTPYISIAGNANATDFNHKFSSIYPAIPSIINLNSADSTLLDRGINGIGAVLAHKIVARRSALGGFVSVDQLMEIYHFQDTALSKMKKQLYVDAGAVHKMDLNTVTLTELSTHPYIGEKLGKNILLYRSGIGSYHDVAQLRQVPLMSEEIYRKIVPYFTVGNQR